MREADVSVVKFFHRGPNEALQVIYATLLTSDSVTIRNIPQIADVDKIIELLECMGVTITRESGSVITFKAENINLDYLQTPEFRDQA